MIQNSGTIKATIPGGGGGRILIEAAKSRLGGTIDASGVGNGDGGTIEVYGEDIEVSGNVLANGRNGGTITVGSAMGENATQLLNVSAGANISANGSSGRGGTVNLAGAPGGLISVDGLVSATGTTRGGTISVVGADMEFGADSTLDASGGSGGNISVRSSGVVNANGLMTSAGLNGSGGRVNLSGANGVNIGSTGGISSSGATTGGFVGTRSTDGNVSIAGAISSDGAGVAGGMIKSTGIEVSIGETAVISADGNSSGGRIFLGGGFQGGDPSMRNALRTTVVSGAHISSDAGGTGGRGGLVVVWSDEDTLFDGDVSAIGGIGGRGGSVEISGKDSLGFNGMVDVTAQNGLAGIVLFDPTNVRIQAGGAAPNIDNVALSNLLDAGNNVVISTNIGGGDAGHIAVINPVEWYQDTAGTIGGTLTLLAQGNVTIRDDVRSAGSGGINIAAGWDGSTGIVSPLSGTATLNSGAAPGFSFNFQDVLDTMNDGNAGNDAAGLGDGSVYIGNFNANGSGGNSNFNTSIEVGSRFGDTNIAAHDLQMRGRRANNQNRWVQLGFRDTGEEWSMTDTGGATFQSPTINGDRNEWYGDATGNVAGKDYITLLGGTQVAGGSFLGAGHGTTGDITVQASGRVEVMVGSDDHSYAQIGHGGTAAEGRTLARNRNGTDRDPIVTRDGFTMDSGDDARTRFGASWRTNYINAASGITLSDGQVIDSRVNGDIKVEAGDDILVISEIGFETTAGYEDLTGDNRGDGSRYSKIGHGGQDNFGSYHGDITVIAHGALDGTEGRGKAGSGIQVRGGRGSITSSSIGHGGFYEGNRRTIYDQTASGDIVVRAETGAVRLLGYNLLPRNGDVNAGTLTAADAVHTQANTSVENQFSNVQIGHGGYHRDDPAGGGSFTTGATGLAVLNAGAPQQNMSGDITVFAGGTVEVRDNMGYDNAGNWVEDLGPGFDPYDPTNAIVRNVGVEVRAGNSESGSGQIGHGGHNFRANDTNFQPVGMSGDITVTAEKGSIMFIGGEEKRSRRTWGYGRTYAQLGHGGYDARTDAAGFQGNITATAGLGAGATDGDIIFRSGRAFESQAQLGHGGYTAQGVIAGDGQSNIVVGARDNIEFTVRKAMPTNAATLTSELLRLNVTNEEVNRFVGIAGGNVVDADTRPQIANRGTTYDVDRTWAQLGHGGDNFGGGSQL
ncbi:hypothetical protein OAE56_03915, partial [Verrucomicrobiales bacterium]|nr:hypothetical protein [Verrucomicrobiales bacterium]